MRFSSHIKKLLASLTICASIAVSSPAESSSIFQFFLENDSVPALSAAPSSLATDNDADYTLLYSNHDDITLDAISITIASESKKSTPTKIKYTKPFALADYSLSNDDLDNYRGTSGLNIGLAELEAVANDNSVNNSITGANAIGGQAFGDAQGFVNVIQNSGNNVIIQSSTIVNVTLQ